MAYITVCVRNANLNVVSCYKRFPALKLISNHQAKPMLPIYIYIYKRMSIKIAYVYNRWIWICFRESARTFCKREFGSKDLFHIIYIGKIKVRATQVYMNFCCRVNDNIRKTKYLCDPVTYTSLMSSKKGIFPNIICGLCDLQIDVYRRHRFLCVLVYSVNNLHASTSQDLITTGYTYPYLVYRIRR